MHSAGSAAICKGDLEGRQMEFVMEESPHCVCVEAGKPGIIDEFIGIAPCCPPNLGMVQQWTEKHEKKRKLYWFKSCDGNQYMNWDFSNARRCVEVEIVIVELLAKVCEALPVDPSRIYFFGASGGGYGVLRLAELVCELPAAIAPMAGYYPDLPEQDHCIHRLVDSLQQLHVWPLHCKDDKLCKINMPDVEKVYTALRERSNVNVEWVDPSIASGSQKNFHSPHRIIYRNPDDFFGKLLAVERNGARDPVAYLLRRLDELRCIASQRA